MTLNFCRCLIPVMGAGLLLAACAHVVKPAHAQPPATPPTAATTSPATAAAIAAATGYAAQPAVQAFITRLIAQDGFQRDWLEKTLGAAERQDSVLTAISRPYEAKPWYEYKPLFVNDVRIAAGVKFWNTHSALLEQAQKRYGVAPGIIVAILGVESFYGRQKGGYSVLNALATLAFDYPPRATFFQNELEQYLLMCREQGLDPKVLTGSYAGAMGVPQFMPDSYRQYAVTLDGRAAPDIWNNWGDIIGSVANYFHAHGWQAGGLVAVPAALPKVIAKVPATLTPTTVGALRADGVVTSTGLSDDTPAMLVDLQLQHGTQYWIGLDNFRAILRYNKSPLYAMAVYDLASRIAEARTETAQNATP